MAKAKDEGMRESADLVRFQRRAKGSERKIQSTKGIINLVQAVINSKLLTYPIHVTSLFIYLGL